MLIGQINTNILEKIQIVVFLVEKDLYGVNLLSLDEIVPMMLTRPVPKAPEFLEGVINLRGEIIPVVDLKKIFGYARDGFPLESRILIARVASKKIGFMVDAVTEIKEITKDSLTPDVFRPEQAHFFEGMAKLEDGQMVQMLAMEKILDEQHLQPLLKLEL